MAGGVDPWPRVADVHGGRGFSRWDLMFWQRWLERREAPVRPNLAALGHIFGSGLSSAGVSVTPEKALGVPAVFSCVQVLSQDVARTPIRLRRKVANDAYVDATDHDLFEILHDLPNPEQTAYQVKADLMQNLLAYGKAYAQVVRVDGRVTALWPLDSRGMRVDRDAARRKRWTYSGGDGQTYSWTFDPSTPPIFELVYNSPISRCRELIGIALGLQTFTGAFFANGGRLPGALQTTGTITPERMRTLREAWNAAHSGVANSHKIAVLDGGIEYKAFAANNQEAQLTETLQAVNQMIAGVFRVPTWKIGDLSHANYSNMEAGEIAYVTSTLDPLYECWESAIQRDLLTNRQFGQFQVQFDRGALIRSDVKAQHDAIAVGVNTGFYSQNDARKMLGLNPIPDGDRYRVNSALQPVGGDPHVG
jgi:HK97 family phage portal protein